MRKKIAITVGDPSGIGPEIIAEWAARTPELLPEVEAIGHRDFLSRLPAGMSVREVGNPSFKAVPGRPEAEGAQTARLALEAAAKGCLDGLYRGVVTAPISKLEMRKVGFDFPGQTEFFAARWGGVPVMCFAGKRLLMSLVTWHQPLRDIPDSICESNVSRAVRCAAKLAEKLRETKCPKIAVCGLNPHAGEGGILGREEIDVINPILAKLRKTYPNLSDALPPDTVFERQLKGEFHSCVAMYHDQGLAPLKTLEFDSAVNISMNLPFVRTSPDHGTAFSIAGKSAASPNSFAQAVFAAMKLC
ncbi:MAG: 4-hydroxythreonine-4-phosphate dehydrogenase PdxA [Verrucomicrobia bacterium]|nr:MAG: 4-hydroxythreonine-4-phosphate dehydrogenase PdxA [Verrucomicrobiota bacterium]